MAKTDRAQKAAETRAKNAELAQKEAEQLANETKDGRGAKKKALKNAVWKTNPNKGQHRDASGDDLQQEERRHKKRKRHHERKDNVNVGGTYEGEEEEIYVKKQRKSQRAPAAATIPSDESEVDDINIVPALQKKYTKDYEPDLEMAIDVAAPVRKHKATKPGSLQDSGSSLNGSDDDSESESSSQSNSSSSTEDSENGELNDEDLMNERPRFVGAGDSDDETMGNSATHSSISANDLFKISDGDVDMPSRPSSRMSSRSTRSGTAPPTTDFDTDDGSSPGVKVTRNGPTKHSKMRAEKKPGRRAQAFAAERPKIKTSSKLIPQTNRKVDAAAVAEGQWPPGARLVLPASGKPSDLGLRHQHPLIQSIIRKAIQKVTDEMVLRQAWPEAKERPLYEKTILLDACREITEECDDSDCHDIKAVKRRIKKKVSFAKALANVAIDRLSTLRAPAKREAEKSVPYYKLGLGKECEERVQSLFLHHSYVFPGTWGSGERDSNMWQPTRREPYLNAAIIDTLKAAFFSKPSSLGNQYLDKFWSTLPDMEEHELSISLVALGATGVYAALYEFNSGFYKELPFSGNTFIRAYTAHVASLEKLKSQKPTQFHEVMSKLYKFVVSVPHDVGDTVNGADDIFSIIDL